MPLHLDKKDVPETFRRNYSGRKFQLTATSSITINNHEGYWSGGSRETWTAIRTLDGAEIPLPDSVRPGETTYQLQPGIILVSSSIFCGKDMGLHFHVHPDDAAKLLPPQATITPAEEFVLLATRHLKSSYAGVSRKINALRNPTDIAHRFKDFALTPDDWDRASTTLRARKLLNKAGSITTAGKNAIATTL